MRSFTKQCFSGTNSFLSRSASVLHITYKNKQKMISQFQYLQENISLSRAQKNSQTVTGHVDRPNQFQLSHVSCVIGQNV